MTNKDKDYEHAFDDGYLEGLKAERLRIMKLIDNIVKELRLEIDAIVGGDASWQTFARINSLEDLKNKIKEKEAKEW